MGLCVDEAQLQTIVKEFFDSQLLQVGWVGGGRIVDLDTCVYTYALEGIYSRWSSRNDTSSCGYLDCYLMYSRHGANDVETGEEEDSRRRLKR